MSVEDRIRRAYQDLAAETARQVDPHARLRRLTDRRRERRLVPALAAATLIAVVVGGAALLGVFAQPDVMDPAATTAVTPPSITATTAPPVTPPEVEVEVPSVRPLRTLGEPWVVVQTSNGGLEAGPLQGERRLVPSGTRTAVPDGMGGMVLATPGGVVHVTAAGEERLLTARPDASLVDVVALDGVPAVVVVTDQGLVGWPLDGGDPQVVVDTHASGALDGAVAAAGLSEERVVLLLENADGCRRVVVAALDGSGATELDSERCTPQENGYPVAVAVDADHVAVVERVTAGEIEFTAERLAVYSATEGGLLRHVPLDAPLDIDIRHLDLVDGHALVAGEYLWRVAVEEGWVDLLWHPAARGEAVLSAFWSGLPSTPAPTHRVTGVAADDVLNVRARPDPSAPVVAELDPLYAGVAYLGGEVTAPDGGTWWEVALLDPVGGEQPVGVPYPQGWVNAAFLQPLTSGLPIGPDEVVPCSGAGRVQGTSGQPEGTAVDAIHSLRVGTLDGCRRVVVTFGSEGPSAGVPSWELQGDGDTTVLRFPSVSRTSLAPSLPGTAADGVVVVREPDGSLSVEILTGARQLLVTPVAGRGALVIDLVPSGELGELPFSGAVALTRPLTVDGEGRLRVEGVARPFEATLAVRLTDLDGNPVEADFSGSDFLGSVRASEYAVTATDWTEAWGRFSFEVRGLQPGAYRLVLVPDTGSDHPRGTTVPFTVP